MKELPSFEITVVDMPPRVRAPRKSQKRPPYVPRPKVMREYECANCGEFFAWPRDKAFCSLACWSVADIVRYRRSVQARYPDGAPDDVAEAVRTKMAHVLGGGYDKKARRLTPARREEVWTRDGGKCVLCGDGGDEIDHIEGPSSELSNLRLLCRPCHSQVTRSHFQPIADDDLERKTLVAEILVRVASPVPLHDCDAPEWSEPEAWRRWARAHIRPIVSAST